MMIETHGLSQTFRSRKGQVEAVRGIDLTVLEGEIFGFLGPNGAGKTTSLRMLATLLPPTAGRAMIAGVDLLRNPAEVRKHIGYVSQSGGSDPTMTAHQELVIQGRVYGMSKADATANAERAITTFELSECADRKTGTYSGGQRRRLDLALGMVHSPRLLFLDEPTTGLDPQSRAHLWDWVRRLREQGMTVFLCTHYLDEADSLCDRLAIIDHGVIVAEGTSVELKRDIAGDVITLTATGDRQAATEVLTPLPSVRSVEPVENGALRLYVDLGEQAMAQILRALDSHGLGLKEISLSRPSLDDVFLRKTGRSLRDETL
jgi:ABC-2 type transport system ATP-binding protein